MGIQVPLQSWAHPTGCLGVAEPQKLAVPWKKINRKKNNTKKPPTTKQITLSRGLTVCFPFQTQLEQIAEEQVGLMEGGGDAVGSWDGSQSSLSNPTDPPGWEPLCWGGICLFAVLHSAELPRCARIPAGCRRHGNPLAPLRRGHKSPPGSGAATISDLERRRSFPWNGGSDPRSGRDLSLASRTETGEHPRCGMPGSFGSEQRGGTSRKDGRERICESAARRDGMETAQHSSPLPVPLPG